jgi:hypothetical protein
MWVQISIVCVRKRPWSHLIFFQGCFKRPESAIGCGIGIGYRREQRQWQLQQEGHCNNPSDRRGDGASACNILVLGGSIPHVQPSSKREGFAAVPGVSWDEIGALEGMREDLTLSVLEPICNPENFQALGILIPAGVMLYGPPGCGKTLLAKANANESGANFISIKGHKLLDKYVGESEWSVRLVFESA